MRWTAITIMILLLLGCAHGGSPVVPSDTDGNPDSSLTSPDRTVQENGRLLWGLFDVTIDPGSGTVEAIPMRGASFKANVTQFVQPPRGLAGWVSFSGLDFSDFETDGIVRLDVGLTHPFPGLNQYRGFDVMGVFMSDATHRTGVDINAILPENDGSEARLLNADGHTRWFNPTEFPNEMLFGFVPGIYGTPGFRPSGTVNGYKYYADDLDPEAMPESFFDVTVNLENRGSFTPGSVNHRDYEIQFPDPGGALRYQYAIIASWEPPSNPTNPTLDDFSLQANQAEPFLLIADTSDSTVYYVDESDFGGSLHVDLTVYDWQALEGEGGGVSVPDGIDGIWVESFFDVFMVPADGLPDATAAPDGPASSTFSFDIGNITPTHSGVEDLIISVWSADPDTYDQGFGAPASTGRLASYMLSSVTIGSESPYNQAPSVGEISGETEPMEVDIDDYTVAALDPEGDQLHFGWSLVDDGEAEDWTQPWADEDTITVDWADYGIGNYDLHCRVRDDYNPWQLATNSPLDIEVMELNITCGTDSFDFWGPSYGGSEAIEVVYLSNGQLICQDHYQGTSIWWNDFELFESMYDTDVGGYCYSGSSGSECDDDWCAPFGPAYPLFEPSTDGENTCVMMDCDPAGTWGTGAAVDDTVAFIMDSQSNIIRYLYNIDVGNPNQDPEYFEAPSCDEATSSVFSYPILAMDFDEDGDLWVLEQGGNVYELLKDDDFYVDDELFTLDMEEIAPGDTVVFDWAISYLSGDFFLFTDEPDGSGNDGGTIHKISGTSGGILKTVHNALSTGVSNPSWGELYGNRGDIEIDHRIFDGENPLAEQCRLVVGGGPGLSEQGAVFARYDQSLELLSVWDSTDSAAPDTCNNAPSDQGSRYIIFDPIDHTTDDYDHTLWAGDTGANTAHWVWTQDCRPMPSDWDGWG